MKKTGKTYLLDTNIIIDLFSNDLDVLEKLSNAKLTIPSVVIGELYFGANVSKQLELRVNQIEEFILGCEVISIDQATSKLYGKIKAQLKNDGTPIPENDVWIAALACQHNFVLVTRDKHFDKPKGVKVEFW